jgi:hypothetical protein
MKLTKIQLSNCIQKHLKIDTTDMTTEQMIKIIKHALEKKELKDIILSTLVLPHCSLPKHNNKDKLCLSMVDLQKLAKKNNIKVSQTREKLCQELESKGLLIIVRKSSSPKKTIKLIKLSPEEILLFKKYNLETNVNSEQLKDNYKQLKLKLHPDRGGDPQIFKDMFKLNELHVQYGFDKDITLFIKREDQNQKNCIIC